MKKSKKWLTTIILIVFSLFLGLESIFSSLISVNGATVVPNNKATPTEEEPKTQNIVVPAVISVGAIVVVAFVIKKKFGL